MRNSVDSVGHQMIEWMDLFNPARSQSGVFSFPDHLLDALGVVHGWVPGRVQRDDSYLQEAHILI